jgi:hypothetical protein
MSVELGGKLLSGDRFENVPHKLICVPVFSPPFKRRDPSAFALIFAGAGFNKIEATVVTPEAVLQPAAVRHISPPQTLTDVTRRQPPRIAHEATAKPFTALCRFLSCVSRQTGFARFPGAFSTKIRPALLLA